MAARKRSKREPAPGWAWMLFGLSLGLSVALVVFLKSGQPLVPRLESNTPEIADRSVPEATAPTQTNQTAPEPIENPSAEEDNATELSFYTELADQEVIVSENEFDFGASAEAMQEVIIQAGSFPTTQAADTRRARLALLGLESYIERATINGITYHRVIVGPLSEGSEVNSVLRRLRSARIDTVSRVVAN